MGETGLTHDIFFEFLLGPFEVVEAEGGRLVNEADYKKKISFPNLLSMLWYFFPLEMP